MARPQTEHIVVIGAGAAGLMAARELGRAGRRVTILEARDRCGGRIHPLPGVEFGYPAEGGAEFVHGEAPVTRGLLREARLSLLPIQGTQWTREDGKLVRRESQDSHEAELHKALQELKDDLPVAQFLRQNFADPKYDRRYDIQSSGWSRATMLPIRSGPAPSRFGTSGWMGDGARKPASPAATAPSSTFWWLNAAAQARRFCSTQPSRPSKQSMVNGSWFAAPPAIRSSAILRSSPCLLLSCSRSHCPTLSGKRRSPLSTSVSATSLRSCCASRRAGGPISDRTFATLRFCFLMRGSPSGGRSFRMSGPCSPAGSEAPRPRRWPTFKKIK